MATSTIKAGTKPLATFALSGWHTLFPFRADTANIYIFLNGFYAVPNSKDNINLTCTSTITANAFYYLDGTNTGNVSVTIERAVQHSTGLELICTLITATTGKTGFAVLNGSVTVSS